jgi:DMSO/TMAO reductase YedYZ molybdopterin-dependent catalytic subunit
MASLKESIEDKAAIRKKTALSFLLFILLIALGTTLWFKLRKQPLENGALKPLRTILFTNENVFSNIFSNGNRTKTYTINDVEKKVKVNGDAGMSNNFDPAQWKLRVAKAPGDTLLISLDDIKAMPKTEIIFDFKCIEGWSQVTRWAGVTFSDFIKKYGLDAQAQLNYTGLNTPDKEYYVGIDKASMMHPQTILCYEMNGEPLPANQGYPLRLIIPVKYGVKHLKRIGTIFFSNQRPPDYWYERGYDYYCGL